MTPPKLAHYLYLTEAARTILIGDPALWKTGHQKDSGAFILPAGLINGIASHETIEKWAEETREGKIPEGWEAPAREDLAHILKKGSLELRHNATLREIRICDEGGGFSLRMTLASIDKDLSEKRLVWLDAFLNEASAYWPLVRFGLAKDGMSAIAEVNLSGAPPEVLEALLQPALDSFRWIIAGLVETAEFITDSNMESDVLEALLPVGHAA